ncbi:MAG: DUF2232 domain-containing protein [Vulcanimicrobiota bacterium]
MSLRLFTADRRDTVSRIIAQGGLLASITVILTSLGNILSLVEILQYLALTPLIIAGIMRGTSFSIQVAVASTLLIGMIWGFFPGSLFFFISTVPLGVLLGYLFTRTREMKNIIIVTVIVLSISISLILFLSIRFFTANFTSELLSMAKGFQAFISGSISYLIEILRRCGFSDFSGTVKFLTGLSRVTPEQIMRFFVVVTPSLIFLTSLTYSFYIWLFNAFVLNRLRILRKDTSYFVEIFEFFRLPLSVVAVFVVSLAILGFERNIRNDVLFSIGINLFGITSLLFFFTGMFNIRRYIHIRSSRLFNLFIFIFCISIGLPVTILAGISVTVSDAMKRKSSGRMHLRKT